MDKSKASEYDNVAAEFMDMWQKQWAAALTSPDTIKAMLAFFRQVQSATGGGYGNPFSANMEPFSTGFGKPATSNNDGAASGLVEPVLAELASRVAACEARLAALEAGSAAGVREPRRKNGKPAAGGSRTRSTKIRRD